MIRDALKRITGKHQSASTNDEKGDGSYDVSHTTTTNHGSSYYDENEGRKQTPQRYGDASAQGSGSSVGAGGYSPAQSMIEQGRQRDRKYGYAYGNYYEKRAMKKVKKMHEIY